MTLLPASARRFRPSARRALPVALLFLVCLLAGACNSGTPTGSDRTVPPHGASPPPHHPAAADVTCPAFDPALLPAPVTTPSAPAGTLAGAFHVSDSGDAVFTFPLAVPPGRGGLEPHLAVTYDSAGGNGPLGIGFSLTGLSAISLGRRNLADDPTLGRTRFDGTDPLYLDGLRLVSVAHTAGTNPGRGGGTVEYRTVPDTFMRVIATLPYDAPGPPVSFEARARDGRILFYGTDPTSRVLALNGASRAWWVREVRDRSGNTLTVTYLNDARGLGAGEYTAEHLPGQIDYGGNTDGTPPTRQVLFAYEDRANDAARNLYADGVALARTRRLHRVTTSAHGVVERAYELDYEASPTTSRSRLQQLTECDGGGVCKPPTLLRWSQAVAPGFTAEATDLPPPFSIGATVMALDVDGDGRQDVVTADIDPQWIGANSKFPAPWTDWFIHPSSGGQLLASTSSLSASEVIPNGGQGEGGPPDVGTALDYDQDGRTDILLHKSWSDTWQVLLSTPGAASPFTGVDTGIQRAKKEHLADLNGDGAPDLIECASDVRDDNPAWTAHLWSPGGWASDADAIPIDPLAGYPCESEALQVVDLDRDGRVDLLTPVPGQDNYLAISLDAGLHAQGPTPWELHATGIAVAQPGETLLFVDVNGDGLPDVLRTSGQGMESYLGTGLYHLDAGPSLPPNLLLAAPELAIPIDANGDGMDDLMIPATEHDHLVWRVLYSAGDGSFTLGDGTIPYDPLAWRSWGPRVIDLRGDGGQDVVVASAAGYTIYRNNVRGQDLLVGVSDGLRPFDPADGPFELGVSIVYGTLVDDAVGQGQDFAGTEQHPYVSHYDGANGCAFPRRCVVGPKRVVQWYAFETSHPFAPHAYAVQYRDGRYDRGGRGWLGFGARVVRDQTTGQVDATFYDNVTYDPVLRAYPQAGQAKGEWTYGQAYASEPDATRVALTYSDTTLATVRTHGDKTFFVYPAFRVDRQEDGQLPQGGALDQYARDTATLDANLLRRSTTTIGNVDAAHGDVLELDTHTDGADLATTVRRHYANEEPEWLISRLDQETTCTTAGGTTSCTATRRSYDAAGLVKTDEHGDPSDPDTQVRVVFDRDAYGNVVRAVATDPLGDRRVACTSYDAEHVFPFAHGNPAGHLTYERFDPVRGVRVAAMDPNGLVTTWAHDGFGRTTEEHRADGTSTLSTLSRLREAGAWAVRLHEKTGGVADDTVDFDLHGRPVRSRSAGVRVGGHTDAIAREVGFDATDTRVAWSTIAHAASAPLASVAIDTYQYDSLGRVLAHTAPWKATSFLHYAGRTVTAVDALGHVTVRESDPLGRLTAVTDARGGQTTYTYGALGALATVTDSANAVTIYQYDALGRVRQLDAPDAGTSTVLYNGFSDRRQIIDGRGGIHDYEHDALGRRTASLDSDGVTRWTWDTAAHGIGELAEVTLAAGPITERYTYDALGRPAGEETTIEGETFQASQRTYDPATGLLRRVDYPTAQDGPAFAVENEYDGYGHLTEVRDATSHKPFWTWTGTDGAGRVTEERFGNKVITERAYFDDRDRAQRIKTFRGAKKLQDLWYDYDDALNLSDRRDEVMHRIEGFTYDELDRLTCNYPGALANQCLGAYGYDPQGRLASKTGVGTYGYDPSHPHAVTTAGPFSYAYDAAGNQITRSDGTTTYAVAYTAFAMPRSFTPLKTGEAPGAPTILLDYDGNQQRVRKTTPDAVTVTLGGLYERVTSPATGHVEHRFYVEAAGQTVAVIGAHATTPVGAGEKPTYARAGTYIHLDALGSVDVLTDDHGHLAERRSYDPFGARRDPATLAPLGAPPASPTPMGFTGQDDDDDLGLVNMRGRLYDRLLGRFLTPDPVVSAPASGQSWDRYAYVFNNPLKYVDPTGFEPADPPPPNPTGATTASDAAIVFPDDLLVGLRPPPNAPPDLPQAATPADAGATGGTPSPTDLGTSGDPPAPTPTQAVASGLADAWIDSTIGHLQAFALESSIPLLGNIQTGLELGKQFAEKGTWAAVNVLVPIDKAADTAAEAKVAADHGDYRTAASRAYQAAELSVGIAVTVVSVIATGGEVAEAAVGAGTVGEAAATRGVSAAEGAPRATTAYKRPAGATTSAQRASVQGKACVDCGAVTPRQVADHKTPLVQEHYETGSIDKGRMRSLDAVQSQCPTCSARQGADMSRYSKEMRGRLGQ